MTNANGSENGSQSRQGPLGSTNGAGTHPALASAKKTPKQYHYTKKTGRPSSYRPEYCQQLVEFMQAGGKEFVRPLVVSMGGHQGSQVVDHVLGKLPALFEDFAVKIGVTTPTLLAWTKQYQEFLHAYQKAKAIQLSQMIQGGISGAYNPACTIFALKNMHGWRDRDFDESNRPAQPAPRFIFHINGVAKEVSTAELLNGR